MLLAQETSAVEWVDWAAFPHAVIVGVELPVAAVLVGEEIIAASFRGRASASGEPDLTLSLAASVSLPCSFG